MHDLDTLGVVEQSYEDFAKTFMQLLRSLRGLENIKDKNLVGILCSLNAYLDEINPPITFEVAFNIHPAHIHTL